MINMKDLIKQQTNMIRRQTGMKLNEGGEKTYKAIMGLEIMIREVEKLYKKEKSGMTKDRAKKMEKSIKTLKLAWNNLYADTQGR